MKRLIERIGASLAGGHDLVLVTRGHIHGMAIAADTPEEIAVSIVGELIQQRAGRRKTWRPA